MVFYVFFLDIMYTTCVQNGVDCNDSDKFHLEYNLN